MVKLIASLENQDNFSFRQSSFVLRVICISNPSYSTNQSDWHYFLTWHYFHACFNSGRASTEHPQQAAKASLPVVTPVRQLDAPPRQSLKRKRKAVTVTRKDDHRKVFNNFFSLYLLDSVIQKHVSFFVFSESFAKETQLKVL